MASTRTSPPAAPADDLDHALIEWLIARHQGRDLPRLRRLHDYYRNPMADAAAARANAWGSPGRRGQGDDRRYRLAQEDGLPARLVGPGDGQGRREIVIENDIAWRLHTLVDFMFGRPVVIQSLAAAPRMQGAVEALLRQVFDAAGGIAFFQDLALLGSIYGYADVVVRLDEEARAIALDLVEAPRAIPILAPGDYRVLDGYLLHYHLATRELAPAGLWDRLRQRVLGGEGSAADRGPRTLECLDVLTAERLTHLRGPADRRVVIDERVNRLGRVPVVHFQNLPQPFHYEGLSEVEPLIPLQDELNTRLSDRANRVTFQSFKMYLGRCIDGFNDRPVGPGQMWQTDNPQASIQEFGGDAASPSEDAHIAEVRQALDKASGVTEVAAGLLRDKVGNLTSENALRIVLLGLLARTQKKRVTYGAGLERLCDLILHAADVLGLLPNRPEDRRVRLDWPSPLPEDQTQRLRDARLKVALGVPRKQVLAELGYGET